jgi:hypothetical protein
MNRQDIIRMAKEAGLDLDGENIFSPKSDPQVDVHIADLEAFAALVASAERETCAKVCDAADKSTHPADLADAIRARGQA